MTAMRCACDAPRWTEADKIADLTTGRPSSYYRCRNCGGVAVVLGKGKK